MRTSTAAHRVSSVESLSCCALSHAAAPTLATCNGLGPTCSIGTLVNLPNGTLSSSHFYVFPFTTPSNANVQCPTVLFGCPNLHESTVNPFPIANTSTLARATHLTNGEYIDFNFTSAIGAM